MSELFKKGELTEKEKLTLEYIKNNPIFRDANEQGILRRAFMMLRELNCEIVVPDEVLLNPLRFLDGLSVEDRRFAVAFMDVNGKIKIPYLVKVPDRYVICLSHFRNDIERKERIKELEAKVAAIRHAMQELEISEERGKEMKITLNGVTRERLTDVAWAKYEYASKMGNNEDSIKYSKIYTMLLNDKEIFV